MKMLTVFTPAYNRAYCLHHLYNSLVNQSCQDFEWLVVDDGSQDNTRELVQSWIDENLIPIRYFYKKNGGMHTAHNLAYENIQTEINVCMDSDDYMPLDAVESIITSWNIVKDNPRVAGMVGLDQAVGGGVLGPLPRDLTSVAYYKLQHSLAANGDKKFVYRTDIVKKYPKYPEYENEKLVPLSYLYFLIGRDYDIVCFNKIWALIDYQPDGSSATITKQYFQSPTGFRDAKFVEYQSTKIFKYKFKAIVHYGFTSLIKKDSLFFMKSPNPLLSILLLPLSVFVYLFMRYKLSNIK